MNFFDSNKLNGWILTVFCENFIAYMVKYFSSVKDFRNWGNTLTFLLKNDMNLKVLEEKHKNIKFMEVLFKQS